MESLSPTEPVLPVPESQPVPAPVLPMPDTQPETPASASAPAPEAESSPLFGDDEAPNAPEAAQPPDLQAAPLPVEASAPAGEDDELPDEEDLFGEDEEIPDEADLFGDVGDAGEEDLLDEEALFGEEPAADAEGPAAVEQDVLSGAISELSDMDEKDIFGEMSEEEPLEKIEDVILRRRPAPSGDRPFMSLRLPNVLSVEKSAFNPRNISQALLEGYREVTTMQGNTVARLVTPENCIRWRFKKGPDGQNLTDEDGRPQYESNSRVVEWEDGSKTLHVGAEVYNLSDIPDRVLLFEENSQDVQVCHGLVKHRLIATPRNLNSDTHERLKQAQYKKLEPSRRTMLISPQEQLESKQLLELQMGQKKAQMKRKRGAEPGAGAEITAAFLEDDQPAGQGPSVRDIKNEVKKMRTA